MRIAFNDLKPLNDGLAAPIADALRRVRESGWFILGPECEQFEAEFASYIGVSHAVGVANGTDAIELMLRALDIGPGTEVITVSHTAVATVAAIEAAGATPVLVDVDPGTYTMDPAATEAAMTSRTAAILPVHLYGHPAAIENLAAVAGRHGVHLLEDCAQAAGATVGGRRVGSFGAMASFSFYPTKTLGALGDAGAIVTDDAALAERLRRLRNYGQTTRYLHVERGVNSRLDEFQAAILRVKLPHLDAHNAARQQMAATYSSLIKGPVLPEVGPGVEHVFHLYVIRHPDRDGLQRALAEAGIQTLIHYPVPVHRQAAYADLRVGELPVTDQVVGQILSLPLYVGMPPEHQHEVTEAVSRRA